MTLQDFTTEELKAELKRRSDLVKEEKTVLTPGIKDGDILSYQAVRFATEEEKQKLFDAIKLNGYKWNAETKTLEKLIESKFDPKTLQPFDKVLVKRGTESYYAWYPDFICLPPTDVDDTIFCIGTNDVAMVIPYNDDTKHLIDTNEEAPDYYKYWED